MKGKKYISADAAKSSSRGTAAVFASLIYTVLTAAVCLRSFSEGLPADWTGYILPGVLALNALSLWTVIFSGKKFGLRVVRIVQIIALLASIAVTAAVAEIFVSSLTNTDSLVGRYIDISIISTFNTAGMICLLAGCVAAVLFCISALGYVSAASRAQDGSHAVASGRLLSVMSFIFGIALTVFIPVYLFAGTIGDAIGLDTSLLKIKNVSFDFAAYAVQDYAALAALVTAPVFYFLLSAVGGKMARSKAVQEVPAVVASAETAPVETSFIYTDEPAAEPAVETAPDRVIDPEPCAEEAYGDAVADIPSEISEEIAVDTAEEVTEDIAEDAAVVAAAAIPAVSVIADIADDTADAEDVIAEPVVEPVVEPVAEPVVEPVAEPVAEPIVEPVAEPIAEPIVKAEAAPTAAAVAYIPGTSLIDFGYCENDII